MSADDDWCDLCQSYGNVHDPSLHGLSTHAEKLAAVIANAKWEERTDYAPFVPAWPEQDAIVNAVDWECTSEICRENDSGWAKWERLERGPQGEVAAFIECGHCAAGYEYDENGEQVE